MILHSLTKLLLDLLSIPQENKIDGYEALYPLLKIHHLEKQKKQQKKQKQI